MTRDASRPRTSGVGRAGRLGDTAALVLVVSGAAVYAYAQYRMGQLAAGLASFVVHVIQKRHPAPAHEQENHSRPA